jgi:plastocyanin
MHRFRPAIVPFVLALVLAACGGGGAPSEAASRAASSTAASEAAASAAPSEAASAEASAGGSEAVRVRLDGFVFDPAELTIAVGTQVSFLNADGAAHTVTEGVDAEAAESPIIDDEIAPNQATRYTFDEPGTYEITCLLHPTMNLTVVVEG